MMNPLEILTQSGSIIGIGESSHGSKNEFEWKYGYVLEEIKRNPSSEIICCFESYSESFHKLMTSIVREDVNIEEVVRICLSEMYTYLHTEETYLFLIEIARLITISKYKILLVGIDFLNKEEKQSINSDSILDTREQLMFQNIKKYYNSNALHFVFAHNAHIGRYCEGYESFGFMLKNEFGEKYIAIAQSVSAGYVRAKDNCGHYQSIYFCHDIAPQSLALLTTTFNISPLILPTNDSLLDGITQIQQIGYYLPLSKPWFTPFGIEYFDYIVIHKKSDAAVEIIKQ